MSDDEDDDFQPWTPQGAARLRAAAAELAAAVLAHAEAVAGVDSQARSQEVFAASDALVPSVLAYADAQFDYTGNAYPFGVLHQFEDDEEEWDDADDEEEVPTTGVTVLQRRDYRVVDEAAVTPWTRSRACSRPAARSWCWSRTSC